MTGGKAPQFGERLRRLREAAGLTQEQLADRAGLTANGIAALERGRRRRPYPHTIRALADALALSAEERGELIGMVPRQQGRSDPPPTTSPPPTVPQVRLPAPLTGLVGRERELRELGQLLRGVARLVTLTGPGGVGKTRLGIELAEDVSASYPDGVAFVPLAPLADAELVLQEIARVLGWQEAGGQPMADVLRAHLGEKRLLLVLDNFEQVLDAAPQVADLLASSGGLHVLVTSRAPLRVRGEREYPVSPLDVPDLRHFPTTEEAAAAPAVQLFVERATAATPTFALTQANAATVAAICRRLDGLPLALELAAARLRTLSPTDLLGRLDRVLPLLAGGARDLPARQRTMRDTIGWSYDLLAEPERALLRALAVFAGGWELAAAEAVGAGEAVSREEVLAALMSLVEQSLVVAATDGVGTTRYRLLEPVRAYAWERLEESGEAEEVRQRHAAYYLALAEQAEPAMRSPEQVAWVTRLEREHDNLRAVLGWVLERGEAEAAAHFGYNLYVFWWIRSYHAEGRSWAEAALAGGADLSPVGRARALWVRGAMAMGQGDHRTAEICYAESHALFTAAGAAGAAARPALGLGLLAMSRPDPAQSERYLRESALAAAVAGDDFWAALSWSALAMVALGRGDHDGARAALAEGLALARRAGDRFSRYIALYNGSVLAQVQGDHQGAAASFAEGLVFSREAGDHANIAYCLEGLAAVAVARGQSKHATRLLGAAERLRETVGVTVYNYRPDHALHERTAAAAHALLDEPTWAATWAEGRAMTPEQAVTYALGNPGDELAQP